MIVQPVLVEPVKPTTIICKGENSHYLYTVIPRETMDRKTNLGHRVTVWDMRVPRVPGKANMIWRKLQRLERHNV